MPNPDAAITWRLRELMATAGMFQTTELIEPLRNVGVQLSREQVFRLVTRPPARLNMEVLVALCTILDCTPNDLIEIHPVGIGQTTRTGTTNRPEVSGPSVGSLRPVPARIHRPPRD